MELLVLVVLVVQPHQAPRVLVVPGVPVVPVVQAEMVLQLAIRPMVLMVETRVRVVPVVLVELPRQVLAAEVEMEATVAVLVQVV